MELIQLGIPIIQLEIPIIKRCDDWPVWSLDEIWAKYIYIYVQLPKRQPSLQFRCGLVMENFQTWIYLQLLHLIYIVYPDEIITSC